MQSSPIGKMIENKQKKDANERFIGLELQIQDSF